MGNGSTRTVSNTSLLVETAGNFWNGSAHNEAHNGSENATWPITGNATEAQYDIIMIFTACFLSLLILITIIGT